MLVIELYCHDCGKRLDVAVVKVDAHGDTIVSVNLCETCIEEKINKACEALRSEMTGQL